jgi:hypothetical protein
MSILKLKLHKNLKFYNSDTTCFKQINYLFIYVFIEIVCRYTLRRYLNVHQAASKLQFTVE